MIEFTVRFPESHAHSAREIQTILVRDWPVHDIKTKTSITTGQHWCGDCAAEFPDEKRVSSGMVESGSN